MPGVANATPEVRVDGAVVGERVSSLLDRIAVEDHEFLPAQCVLWFNALAHDILSDAGVEIGAALEVRVAGVRGPKASLFTGEVTGLEARYDGSGTHALVRAYDKAHRLHRGRSTHAYEQMTDSQIAQDVAQRHGLGTSKIEATQGRHEHLSQANQTDWEFLSARAEEIGYEVAVDGDDLVFRTPPESRRAPGPGDLRSGGEGVTLVLGDNLQSFRPRLTSAQQVADVEVRGWDPKQKQSVVGRANAATTSAELDDRPSDLADIFGGGRHVQVDRPLADAGRAKAAAESLSERIGSAFVEAAGLAYGDTRLRAGVSVSVANVARPFVGKYTLSSTRHVFDRHGYTTRFEVTGRQDRSLLGLASVGRTNGSRPGALRPIHGVVVAEVTNVSDPENTARVKVTYPWLDDEYQSPWARVLQPGAGGDRGMLMLPEVGDEVLVSFEHGDVRRPYVVGGLYNGRDKPRGAGGAVGSDGKVVHRAFTSRSGHMLVFDDSQGGEKIAIIDKTGNNEIVIDSKANTITLRCDDDLTIEANGSLDLKAARDVSIEARGGSLELKAAQNLTATANASLELEGTSSATLTGASTEVSGDATTTISGAMVRIN